jgi:nucleotide-binding universal stress UspA family protein
MDEKIVVGVDGSESSRRALQWAARQAKVTGASLEVVIAWEVPPTYRWNVSSPRDLRVGAESILEAAVADVVGEEPDVDVKPAVVEGHPVPVLLNAAQGASLLVVGSRGHGTYAGILLGSVSIHCVTLATCPVTVVRDGGQQDGGDPRLL